MIKVKVNNLKGNEVLAKHVLSDAGIELIAAGTVVKKEYIDKLKILQIEDVYIEEYLKPKNDEGFNLLKEVVKEESVVIVKSILEKHIYKNTAELVKLCQVADDIINNVMAEEEIMTQITNIRENKHDLYSHSLNVCALSTVLSLKAGLERDVVSDIAKGSLLHDIGLRYVVIPYENVNVDKLPLKNQTEIKEHVIFGYDSIKDAEWLSEISKNIVLLHHERNNGTGYPFKNYGESISAPIKIVAVCDTFDSLVGGIGYETMKVHEAVEYMKQMSVECLDEGYVDLLLQMVAMYPIGCKVKTNEGEIGIVIGQNKTNVERPIIKILVDKDGNKVEDDISKDLMKELTLFIVEVIDE